MLSGSFADQNKGGVCCTPSLPWQDIVISGCRRPSLSVLNLRLPTRGLAGTIGETFGGGEGADTQSLRKPTFSVFWVGVSWVGVFWVGVVELVHLRPHSRVPQPGSGHTTSGAKSQEWCNSAPPTPRGFAVHVVVRPPSSPVTHRTRQRTSFFRVHRHNRTPIPPVESTHDASRGPPLRPWGGRSSRDRATLWVSM